MPQKHLPRSQGVARRRMNLFDVPKKNGTGGLFETVKIYQFRPSSLFSDCQMGHCYIIENTQGLSGHFDLNHGLLLPQKEIEA